MMRARVWFLETLLSIFFKERFGLFGGADEERRG